MADFKKRIPREFVSLDISSLENMFEIKRDAIEKHIHTLYGIEEYSALIDNWLT